MNVGYKQNSRYDLFDLILSFQPTQVVEFGAYDGATLTNLSQKHENCLYVAVDNDSMALSQIQSSDISKIHDDLDQPNNKKYAYLIEEDAVTVVLLLDVLEHLRSPEVFMDWLKENFLSNTVAIISVPNVRNWRTFYELLKGDWPQNEYGLFDRTHLHFFTAKSFWRRFKFSGKLLSFKYRYSKNSYLKMLQFAAPSVLCGQMTFVIRIGDLLSNDKAA